MIKINKLEIENVKRVKAVSLEPTQNGLTVIGGRNGQGKTSILDSIAWALGGNKYKPSQPHREGSVLPPNLQISLSNGLEIKRDGKNSDLKVIDPSGQKAGQKLLDSFVEEFALNLPKFMESSSADKARTLLQIIGVGDKLAEFEKKEQELYNERLVIGRVADQKKKFAAEMTYFQEAPKELISVSELIQEQQAILAKNAENERLRGQRDSLKQRQAHLDSEIARLIEEKAKIDQQLEIAEKDALDLHDESTEQLEYSISNTEEINRKVRANLDKDKAEQDAQIEKEKYDNLSAQIDRIRLDKNQLLEDADLPLPGLSVAEGELLYKGQRWDNMSGAEQLKVSTAIVRKLNPECGFILIDKLEQMDLDTLKEFGQWLEQEQLQAIATRVSTGAECSIIISDGYSEETEQAAVIETQPAQPEQTKYQF
ncbi:chromosome segregation protein SMC [Lactococcus lactis subsp. lactis]|uniref:AAA family ATPase n=1 Tax=Lactococcus lactis TaxID=1358 RepID=UPI001F11105B|nr:AAA family ATPase [Lactococcus lactis]MCH5425284.1 AAA family ATPase [Lactococcus lactis]MCT0058548.1 chromosome segregation protein SMC [Lactococcus lactis subsp. lactis]